ncbi:MAG: permease-like cell division protein FtsX [Bacteroidaceae bacterium]|nr:permease-like cell division protein FtsX [Bacteroidaceae bacterium]
MTNTENEVRTRKRRIRKPRRHRIGLQGVTLCISTALVLVLLGLVVITVGTAHNLSSKVKENFIVTLMLGDDITESEAQAVCDQLRQRRYVNQLEYISREQALEEGKKALGADPSEFVGVNFYPPSVELQLNADYANSDSLKWIAAELEKDTKVSEITYPQDLIDSVNSTLRHVILVLLILAGLLAFISFALINNTVRLSVYSRRFSIRTMKLVGASWRFIRRPFMRRALTLGVVSAIIAVIVIAIGLAVFYYHEPSMLDVVTPEVMAITAIAIFFFGICITWLCSRLSVNKFLKMTAGELYKI